MNQHDLSTTLSTHELLLSRLESLSRGIIPDRRMAPRGFVPRCGRGRCSLPLDLKTPLNSLLHFVHRRQDFNETIKKAV